MFERLYLRLFFAILGTVYCLVVIPHPTGGINEYLIEKPAGLFDAVRRALVIDEERLGRRSDETVITVNRGRPAGDLLEFRRAQFKAAAVEGEGGEDALAGREFRGTSRAAG